MAKRKTGALGRGIAALFEENTIAPQDEGEQVQDIKLTAIRANPYQPRRTFDQAALKELAASIEKSGVFQPIILRQPDPQLERYELVAGERRFRASKLAKQSTIPAIVRTMSDEQMMEIAVLENLQREDLTPLEEAQAYQTLMEKLSLTQAQVAAKLGKSRPYIANYLRLLGLPAPIKEALNAGKLSMGQARTILGLKNKRQLTQLANRAVKQNLTVRQLEKIVAQMNGTVKEKDQHKRQRKPVYIREAEDQLQSKFGTKVAVSQSRKRGSGKIEIPYSSNDDLTRILELLDISLD
ncbi:ParB/RepB/Spo0J family partition protein [Limosilactobacillus pontis]|jgi:ParB family chromosome partitioning protein|uniref:ParB/RepB/Spo0J family partition protein n=1 Tax=Limosilactobacillus pontis TaxID=35787 RepID=A0ABT7UVQ1_9LACO|nr:ParB/RepB/Spo0J family partition protein [Limosilactobacillus pontis]MDM8265773.1 ParB/RepB/Spo0J family partition protein [Limosilactobacillus pontis]MDM8331628.1 ParB/RepB/Spo0J family partition protein [Limosilactobacillus pontis]HJA74294.1 ParB/RepB/Spo0J family partition protein [Candidatus Limosilactobacillus gallistercoris]